MKNHRHDPIPTDGRLLRVVRRAADHARNAKLIAKLAPDTEAKFNRPRRQADAADERTLRGIPAIGRGVAGVSPGTRPDAITNRDT
jgi:hypothetical protein